MISLVVATDTQLARQLLTEALNGRSGISVEATAPDPPRALALIENLRPDAVVIGMTMPGAMALVATLADRRIRVVALGKCEHPAVAVVDDGSLADLVAAIHGVMHGAVSRLDTSTSRELDHLTAAERLVLKAVNEGRSNKEIAQELGVAVPTIKHHVHSVLSKLGVKRRGEAAAIFRRSSGLVSAGSSSPSRWSS